MFRAPIHPGDGCTLDGHRQRHGQADAGQPRSRQAVCKRELECHAARGDPREGRAATTALEHPAQLEREAEQRYPGIFERLNTERSAAGATVPLVVLATGGPGSRGVGTHHYTSIGTDVEDVFRMQGIPLPTDARIPVFVDQVVVIGQLVIEVCHRYSRHGAKATVAALRKAPQTLAPVIGVTLTPLAIVPSSLGQ
ncbi:hypothetical protein GA0115234_114725 [Streptomyces sp. DvalAA-43]|nr:hypothetical protein GA0115234_114725 [Streptomyces sp. DvalAA-43]